MNILIIGSGGREHAIASMLSKDARVQHIYIAPGNAGSDFMNNVSNINISDIDALASFAKEKSIDLTFVGSEALLAEGIVDTFKKQGLTIFGPNQAAARLESSKSYAKAFMQKYGIKTADYARFESAEDALTYLEDADYPIVIKADGLAAGKGVFIVEDLETAKQVIHDVMIDKCFQEAGNSVVIETYLQGFEASILSFTDSQVIVPTISAKDHKKIYDNEMGPNTGGMGVVAPNPLLNKEHYNDFIENILKPTIAGIQAEKLDFSGVIFFGLMIVDDEVYLLEYNMRLGDPETQAVLPLMKTPLLDVVLAANEKRLNEINLAWKALHSCCVVLAAEGYPESPKKGDVITGLEGGLDLGADIFCFIAGATKQHEQIITNGGRVLNVVALAETKEDAYKKVYKNISKIDFDGMQYRNDIGE